MHATKTTTTQDNVTLTYEQLYTDCWRYCRGIVTFKARGIDDDTADDLVSDSYESLWRLWSAVEGKPAKQQRMYLTRIVANRVNDYLRRLRLGRAIFVSEAQVEAAMTHAASDYDKDVDAISVQAYLASGRAEGIDSPERIYLAREALAEVRDNLYATVSGDRMWQSMLASMMGYSTPEIGAATGRSATAIKMDMLRGRERIGVGKKEQMRTTVTIRKGAAA